MLIDLHAYRPWLARQVTRLADHEYIILNLSGSIPAPAPEPKRRGIFGRRARPVAVPFVQFLRDGETLTAECGGASAHDAALRAIGWVWISTSHVYRREWPLAETTHLAEFAIDTLKLLGATRAEDVAYESNS